MLVKIFEVMFFIFLLFLVGYDLCDKLDEKFCDRQHDDDGCHVEDGVEHSQLCLRHAGEHIFKERAKGDGTL